MNRIYRRRHQKQFKKYNKKTNKNNNVVTKKYETVISQKHDLAMDKTGNTDNTYVYIESIKFDHSGLTFTM
jgi:hypothetical protein